MIFLVCVLCGDVRHFLPLVFYGAPCLFATGKCRRQTRNLCASLARDELSELAPEPFWFFFCRSFRILTILLFVWRCAPIYTRVYFLSISYSAGAQLDPRSGLASWWPGTLQFYLAPLQRPPSGTAAPSPLAAHQIAGDQIRPAALPSTAYSWLALYTARTTRMWGCPFTGQV
jgi:hypothetical protein